MKCWFQFNIPHWQNPWNICSLPHPPVNMLVWKFISVEVVYFLWNLYKKHWLYFQTCFKSNRSMLNFSGFVWRYLCGKPGFLHLARFFCHCHLFCCCFLFCCYWFVIILMAWLYVSACHHKLLSLFAGLKHSFFLLPLPSFCSLHNSYEANVVCQNQDPQPDFHVTGTCLSCFSMQGGMMELIPDPDPYIRSIQIRAQSLCGGSPHEF